MEDDREDDILVRVELSQDIMTHYARRAEAAGRTLQAQLCYELAVYHGLLVRDPGDIEAVQQSRFTRRRRKGRRWNG
jgi:hypothetical protein